MESQGLAVSGSPRPSPCPCRLPWLQSPQNLLCTPPRYLPPRLHDPLCWESGPLLRGLDSSSFASVGCHFLAEENPSLGQLTRQLDPFLSLCPFRQAPRRAFPPILDVDDRWPGIPLGMGFLIILGVRAKRMMEATPLGPSDLGAPAWNFCAAEVGQMPGPAGGAHGCGTLGDSIMLHMQDTCSVCAGDTGARRRRRQGSG